jgi:CubicO group peptidase (beta-lactamase class C family)
VSGLPVVALPAVAQAVGEQGPVRSNAEPASPGSPHRPALAPLAPGSRESGIFILSHYRANAVVPSMRRLVVLVGGLLVLSAPAPKAQGDFLLERFQAYLQSLATQAGIPGLSAVIVEDRRVIWDWGFGYQDVERRIAATPVTPYQIGGLTQVFTATALLYCVEAGTLRLDDLMSRFTGAIPEATATVAHVLSHTSRDVPGARYQFDLDRFAALGPVVQSCLGSDTRVVLARGVMDRLAMINSVPGDDLDALALLSRSVFNGTTLARYEDVLERMARPYHVDSGGSPRLSEYDDGTATASTGLISTVRDLARLDVAFERDTLIHSESLDLAWSNPVGADGRSQPHGLGWFVQSYSGRKIVWQFGERGDGYSALYLKIPDRELTLILLANSDGLSAPFRLAAGDVTKSLFARLFLSLFG